MFTSFTILGFFDYIVSSMNFLNRIGKCFHKRLQKFSQLFLNRVYVFDSLFVYVLFNFPIIIYFKYLINYILILIFNQLYFNLNLLNLEYNLNDIKYL